MLLMNIFNWLDAHAETKKGILLNQLIPIVTCLVLFGVFIAATYIFIQYGINPYSTEHIQLVLHPVDVAVGAFLYFVTAIDYALIIGRMAVVNTGAKARFVMNVFTCVGCFVGVSVVLFLWGFAKEIVWLIMPLLIFAGSVMIKLAYEGREYFEHAPNIPLIVRTVLSRVLVFLFQVTRIFTFWIPELGSPRVQKMPLLQLAQWAFFLPFIIGLDDLIGYMGAMTIYNAYGLIFGIYISDILIDILIFVSPKFTKKMVESALLSVLASGAFLYLAYKSYAETVVLLEERFHLAPVHILFGVLIFLAIVIGADWIAKRYGATFEIHRRRGE